MCPFSTAAAAQVAVVSQEEYGGCRHSKIDRERRSRGKRPSCFRGDDRPEPSKKVWRLGPTGGWATLGVAYVALRIGLDGGSTPVVGPTLAPRRGRIVSRMVPCDWPACAWTSWPLMVAILGFDFSLLVFRIVWRGLLAVLWIACFGRPRLVAEPRAPEGRLLPHISAGWDRKAASQRRNSVCPLWAGGLACVGPRWPRKGAAMGRELPSADARKSRAVQPNHRGPTQGVR